MHVGDKVTVRGDVYTVVGLGQMGTGKFFGKRTFRLSRDRDLSQWTAYGKRVTANSKLEQA